MIRARVPASTTAASARVFIDSRAAKVRPIDQRSGATVDPPRQEKGDRTSRSGHGRNTGKLYANGLSGLPLAGLDDEKPREREYCRDVLANIRVDTAPHPHRRVR